jgi:hypothetical protein
MTRYKPLPRNWLDAATTFLGELHDGQAATRQRIQQGGKANKDGCERSKAG